MIDQMYLMLYNLFFTSLPPLVIGESRFCMVFVEAIILFQLLSQNEVVGEISE